MANISRRLSALSECRIRNMTRMAQDVGAINLAQGFPDFDPPAELVSAAQRSLLSGFHQYSLTWGSRTFREALAEKQGRFMNLQLDAECHVTATCGATEAMIASLMTVCSPGDKVIIFSPFYENYAADVLLSGAIPIYVSLRPPTFEFDPMELRAAFQQGVKALVLCNPSNPTGKVFTSSELRVPEILTIGFPEILITPVPEILAGVT